MRFLSSTCAAVAALTVAAATSTGPSLTGTDAIPQNSLPTLAAMAPSTVDPISVEAIRQTLALYPLAIDGKNFGALDLVFATNAVANYSAPINVLTPLSTIQSGLESSLTPVTTQHAYGTQLIDILSFDSAFSVTYYTATHFGKGPYVGETVTAFGQYQDVWARQKDLSWKITHRNLVYMVSRAVPHRSKTSLITNRAQ